LVEAGQVLNGALMVHQLIDELLLFYAPMLMGGDGRSLFAMQAFTEMQQAIHLDIIEMRQVGVDIRVRAKPLYKSNVN
jgi:diaminohydroxyphosphoribosylaminopyrimidine deaminase/5-amino-6-(5-phosphoribosylamino)uracil reductase